MAVSIRRGIHLPLRGAPEQAIYEAPRCKKVAILGRDFIGMKPSMLVKVGDYVKKGTPLFECKKQKIVYGSIAGGKILEINRGDKRFFESIVIEVAPQEESEKCESYKWEDLIKLTPQQVATQLSRGGLWSALRTRPYGKTANPENPPHHIFVTAFDTRPFAPRIDLIIEQNRESFEAGLMVLSRLTSGKVWVCSSESDKSVLKLDKIPKASFEFPQFSGSYPSSLPSLHIHHCYPVDKKRMVWHIDAQEVMAIGKLFTEGVIDTSRVISLAGEGVERPRLLKTRLGAFIPELLREELGSGTHRVISGCVFSGRKSEGFLQFLGRYHQQISVISETSEREFLGWLKPGFDKFTVSRTFISKLFPTKLTFNSSLNGGHRAVVPIGLYEKVFPYLTDATYFVRSLLCQDTELAQSLGVLEFIEEDMGVLTFICPGKTDYAPLLRAALNEIEVNG